MASIKSMSDYERRAYLAYLRTDNDEPGDVTETEHNGLRYVTLSNRNGTRAVYRITNQGQLRRLRRWPAALEQ